MGRPGNDSFPGRQVVACGQGPATASIAGMYP